MTRSSSRKAGLLTSVYLTKAGLNSIRALHPDRPMYTFWHYLRNRWERDAGLRLDHLLVSPSLSNRLTAAGVDREVRGQVECQHAEPREN